MGQNEKLNETSFTSAPIQMGARVYLPSVGRFLQMDPVEGGTDNNYAYPNDPVGDFDLSGQCVGLALEFFPLCVIMLNDLIDSYSGGWSSGYRGGRVLDPAENMITHYSEHAGSVNAKSIPAFNRSAWKTVDHAQDLHLQGNNKTAFISKNGKITVLNQNRQLVSHFKPKNPTNYWKNIKER